jgi:Clp amino terminal domain, pathogenicity island component
MTDPLANLDDLVRYVEREDSSGQPLAQLAHAVVMAERLGTLGDQLVGHFVDRARISGASWSEVGQSLGVTKQAAQKRFVFRTGASDDSDSGEASLLARFTGRARAAHLEAVEQARRAKHDHVGTEHLLLALLADPQNRAVQALRALGVSIDEARNAVRATLGPEGEYVGDPIPLAAATTKVEQIAVRIAKHLGNTDLVGTEHLLLALVMEGGKAANVLTALGVRRRPLGHWIESQANGNGRPGNPS